MVRVKWQYYYNLLLLQSWFPYYNVMLELFAEPFFSDGTDCYWYYFTENRLYSPTNSTRTKKSFHNNIRLLCCDCELSGSSWVHCTTIPAVTFNIPLSHCWYPECPRQSLVGGCKVHFSAPQLVCSLQYTRIRSLPHLKSCRITNTFVQ